MFRRKWLPVLGIIMILGWSTPSFARFLQRDPLGEAGGMNLYAYVGNNPVNWIDPWGLSAEDVTKMLTMFRDYIAAATASGRRHPEPMWNNMMRTLYDATALTGFVLYGQPYRSCEEQWSDVELAIFEMIRDNQFDDTWSTDTCMREDKTHVWGIVQSSNPDDPLLILDPWRNKTTQVYVPLPNIPACYQSIIPEQPYMLPIPIK